MCIDCQQPVQADLEKVLISAFNKLKAEKQRRAKLAAQVREMDLRQHHEQRRQAARAA